MLATASAWQNYLSIRSFGNFVPLVFTLRRSIFASTREFTRRRWTEIPEKWKKQFPLDVPADYSSFIEC